MRGTVNMLICGRITQMVANEKFTVSLPTSGG